MRFIKQHPSLVLFCICAVFMTVDMIHRGEYVGAVWPILAAVFDFCATLFFDIAEEQQDEIEKLQEENDRLRREQRDWYA